MSKRLLGICFLFSISAAFSFAVAIGNTASLQRVEEVALRTVDTKTFQNPNGTRTLEIYSVPQHFRDRSGNWKAISTRLSKGSNDPGIGVGQYGLWNEDNLMRTYFPEKADRPIWFVTDTGSVGLKPVSEKQSLGKVAEHGTQYSGIWESADLVYTIRPGCVKEDIVLARPNGLQKYRFELLLKGLTPHLRDSGVISFRNSQGQLALEMPAPFMYEMKNPHKTGAVSMKLVREKNSVYIDLLPDREWLSSPERSFPVVIDPTTISGSLTRSEKEKRHYFFQTTAQGDITWNVSFDSAYSWITSEKQPYLKIGTTYEGSDVLNILAPLNLENWSANGILLGQPAGDYHVTLFGGSWTFIFSGYGTATLSLTYTQAANVSAYHTYLYNRTMSSAKELSCTFSVTSPQTITGTSTIEPSSSESAPYFKILDGTTVLYSHTQAGTQTISLALTAGKTYIAKAQYGVRKVTTSTNHYNFAHADVDATLNFPSLTQLKEKQIRLCTTPNRIISTLTSASDQDFWLFGSVATANISLTDLASGVTRARGGTYDQCDITFKQAAVKDSDYQIQLYHSTRSWTEEVEMERPTGGTYYIYNTYTEDVPGQVLECKLLMAPNRIPTVSTTWPAQDGYAPASANFQITAYDLDWSAMNRKIKTVILEFQNPSTGTIEHTVTQNDVSVPAGDIHTIPVPLGSWYTDGTAREWRARVYDGFDWAATPYSSFAVDSVYPTLTLPAPVVSADNSIRQQWTSSDAHMKEFRISYTDIDGAGNPIGVPDSFTLGSAIREHTLANPGFNRIKSIKVIAEDLAGNKTELTTVAYTLPGVSNLISPTPTSGIAGNVAGGYQTTLVFTQVEATWYQIERYKKGTDGSFSLENSTGQLSPAALAAGPQAGTYQYADWPAEKHAFYQYRIITANQKPATLGGPDTKAFTSGECPVQNTVPMVEVSTPGGFTNRDFRIDVSANDADNDAITYRYQLAGTEARDSGTIATETWTFSALPNGPYTWTVTVSDGCDSIIRTGTFEVTNTTSGELQGNEIWNGVIAVSGDIIVPLGTTLTISPGTRVVFGNPYSIKVLGSIQVEGTPTSPVNFSSLAGVIWKGIQLESAVDCQFTHAAVENCTNGIQSSASQLTVSNITFRSISQDGLAVTGGGLSITGASFTECQRAMSLNNVSTAAVSAVTVTDCTVGFSVVGSSGTISGCTFQGLDYGIHVYNCAPTIDACQFIDIRIYGIKEDAGGNPTVTNCQFSHPTTADTYAGDYYDEVLTILTPEELGTVNPSNSNNISL